MGVDSRRELLLSRLCNLAEVNRLLPTGRDATSPREVSSEGVEVWINTTARPTRTDSSQHPSAPGIFHVCCEKNKQLLNTEWEGFVLFNLTY